MTEKIKNIPRTYELRPDQVDYLVRRQMARGIPKSVTIRQALDAFIKSNPLPKGVE